MRRVVLLVSALAVAPGCLVLSVNPLYDAESLGWESGLLGAWQAADDRSSMQVDRGEWRSYKIRYVHPIENGDLTGYLTGVGDDRFLDLMPARGEDRGSFVVPVHAILRVRLDGDRLELTPLSFDWFFDRLRASPRGTPVPGLAVALDQKENALIVSPSTALRDWLRRQPHAGRMVGAPAVFTRESATARNREAADHAPHVELPGTGWEIPHCPQD